MKDRTGENGYGRPREGHPRQCQCVPKNKGRRCRKWALNGSKYCEFHGGRRRGAKGTVRNFRLPMFYSAQLKGSLSDFVGKCLDMPPHEQMNVFEELALMRGMAGKTVTLYQAAEASKKSEVIANATGLMLDALTHVVKTCEAAARIDALSKDKVSAHNIAFVVDQIVRVAYDTIPEEQARAFEASVREQVRIDTGPEGTALTPDRDAIAMDNSVPAEDPDAPSKTVDTASDGRAG